MPDNRLKQYYYFLLVSGIVIASLNLRPAITSVGPLIGIIRDDIGLSNWSAGFLTSLPLIAFAVMSPLAPKLGSRFSNERMILAGLILLSIGFSIRSLPVFILLFVGTVFAGIGIAILNVLLPSIIKDKFPNKVGLMTSIYTTGMAGFAAASSGLSVPFAKGLNMGWQLTLFIWIIPAILGVIIWIYLARHSSTNDHTNIETSHTEKRPIWKSPLAWQVTCYLGFQSFIFYVVISWLPEILHAKGLSLSLSGWMLSIAQFIGLPASFGVPVLADRLKSQRSLVFILWVISFIGYGGLLVVDSVTVLVISTIFIGISLNGTFSLALGFLGMRARNARQAAELSGWSQAFGYTLAAAGPVFIGYLHDVTQAWTVPLTTILIVTLLIVASGMGAGRNKYILDKDSSTSRTEE